MEASTACTCIVRYAGEEYMEGGSGASRDKVYLMWNVGEMDTRESL